MNFGDESLLASRIRALSVPLRPRPTDTQPRLPALRHIRAVVFDIYGTLLISASGDIGLAGQTNAADALRGALHAIGHPPPEGLAAWPDPFRDIIKAHHAVRRDAGIDYPEVDILAVWTDTLTGAGLRLPPDQLRRLAVEYELRVNPVWRMPGLADTLKAIHASGRRLGIVSNAQFYTPLMFPALLDQSLEQLGFTPDYCAWSYRHLEAKPSTRLYRDVLAALQTGEGIMPEQVLYVGNDRLNDIWPAARCGCRTALFAGDARSLRLREGDPRCADSHADAVVTELPQIMQLLL